jgi:hypothetical protein
MTIHEPRGRTRASVVPKKSSLLSCPPRATSLAAVIRYIYRYATCELNSRLQSRETKSPPPAHFSAPAVDSDKEAQARNGQRCLAKHQRAQGPPREVGLLVYRGPRSAARLCGLYRWSLSVAKSAISSVLTNCYSVARAASDMAVFRAQSIGQCTQRPRCIWDAVWSSLCSNMTEKLWVMWEKIHQLVVDRHSVTAKRNRAMRTMATTKASETE